MLAENLIKNRPEEYIENRVASGAFYPGRYRKTINSECIICRKVVNVL